MQVKKAWSLVLGGVTLGLLLLSGCGLKYDLYLPEDSTNIQVVQNTAPDSDS